MVDSLNSRYKRMRKLLMEKLLNHKISQDYPIIFKFMQVHEDEKVQALSITINDKRVLSLIHARYTKKIQ